MAKYITQADIENVFGKDNVATWSNLDGDTGADTTRIATAIAKAEEDVENRFRNGRYLLPFAPVPETVKNWCAVFAGMWLFENRPGFNKSETEEGFNSLRDKINDEIDAYTSGQRLLNCGLVDEHVPSSPVVVK